MQKDVDNKHLALGKIPHTRRYLASLYSFLVCCLCLCLGASENVKNIKMCQISGNRFNLYSMIFINALKMFSKHIKTHEKSREMLKALEPAVCNVTFLWRLNIIQMATLNIEIFQQLISSAQKQKKKILNTLHETMRFTRPLSYVLFVSCCDLLCGFAWRGLRYLWLFLQAETYARPID